MFGSDGTQKNYNIGFFWGGGVYIDCKVDNLCILKFIKIISFSSK